MGVEEEGHLRGELVDRHAPAADHLLAVGDAVGQGERHLLYRVSAGVAEVGTRHRDRVEAGDVPGAELDRVRNEPHGRSCWPDPRAAGGVLLQHVVLDRAAQLLAGHALPLAGGDVEGQQDRRRAVDREARADLVEGNAGEEDLHVGQGVDGHADPADLLLHLGIVGVVAALRGQVERHRQARAAALEEQAVAGVRLLRCAEARVLAESPQTIGVAAGEIATYEWIDARVAQQPVAVVPDVRRPVEPLDLQAAVRVARLGGCGRH